MRAASSGIGRFLALVDDRLESVLAEEEARLDNPHMATLLGPLRRLVLSEGKRIRPMFCYWGWRGAGGVEDLAVGHDLVGAAAALELVHTCAIVHDDLMDRSERRRGRPSLHRELAVWHRGRRLRGDADDFGTSGALLAGHLCLVWADRLLERTAAGTSGGVRSLSQELRAEVSAGQYLDLLAGAGAVGGSLSSCLHLARLKTAGYTVEKPLHMGGLVGGAGPEVLESYTAYGVPLGVAFQLADDLADAMDEPGTDGGEDLRAGKATALLALARQGADPAELGLLDTWVGSPAMGETEMAAVREVLATTGALDAVQGLIADQVAQAQRALETAPIPLPARAALSDLAAAVGHGGDRQGRSRVAVAG